MKNLNITSDCRIYIIISFVFILAMPTVSKARNNDNWHSCAVAIDLISTKLGTPANMLMAIAYAESGRANPENNDIILPWPWTINSKFGSRYFANKASAVAAANRIIRRGEKNVDIGCMQINWYYHGTAFPSVAQAMDPAHNVGYAAAFLHFLKKESGSWDQAIRLYHSRNKNKGNAYYRRVLNRWKEIQKKHG